MWAFPCNPSSYFYPRSIDDIIGDYDTNEHFGMDLKFILAAVQSIKTLYIAVVPVVWTASGENKLRLVAG